MRFRNQLLVLVLSVVIPAFLAAILAVWYVFSEEQQGQEKGMLEATRTFSLLVGKELQAREAALLTLRNSAALAKGDLAEFYSIARRLAPTPETAIFLTDRSDRQILNTRAPFGAALPPGRSGNFSALLEGDGSGRTLVSDVFLAPVGKRFDFSIQVPVYDAGGLRYFLGMGINASAMQPLLDLQRLPANWLAVILDRQGVVVSRSRNPEQYVGKAATDEFRARLSAAREGVFPSVTLDGVPVKTFFSRVAFSDWTVIVSIPEAELRSAPLRAAAFLAAIMAILLGVAFFVAQRIAASVNTRMEQLGVAAEKLGMGEEVAYRPQGLVEIDT
ncbi:MAG TPA: cache domain-containing protein, partial [Noviherbaspirillum sp.]|nr:cache domain-containing protein [Noviherbaspirillum sp.]